MHHFTKLILSHISQCCTSATVWHVGTSTRTDLLLHFLHLLHRAPSLRAFIVTVTQQTGAYVIDLANVLLFLFLGLLQFALRAETLRMVHVVRLHHL